MPPSIHGHEVLHMMLASEEPYTLESLETAIVKRFGTEARFHTCSSDNMTTRELISFLGARGKFAGTEDAFRAAPEEICDDS